MAKLNVIIRRSCFQSANARRCPGRTPVRDRVSTRGGAEFFQQALAHLICHPDIARLLAHQEHGVPSARISSAMASRKASRTVMVESSAPCGISEAREPCLHVPAEIHPPHPLLGPLPHKGGGRALSWLCPRRADPAGGGVFAVPSPSPRWRVDLHRLRRLGNEEVCRCAPHRLIRTPASALSVRSRPISPALTTSPS